MTVSIVVLGIVCVVLLAALVFREAQHSRHVGEREKTWDLERGALLTRIQHPEIVFPVKPTEVGVEEVVPGFDGEEQDEIDLIGTVVDGAENG